MNKCRHFSYRNSIVISLLAITAIFIAVSCDEQTRASEFPECFLGTYLNQEGSGAKSIWNLHKDGTFAGESSTQQSLNFSGQLGSWVRTGSQSALIVLLDFSFDDEGNFKNTARADISIFFSGDNCEETEGSFELRFFEEGEDPLDLSDYDGVVIEDTFTGRKLVL